MFDVVGGMHKGRDLVGPSKEPLLQRLAGSRGPALVLPDLPSPMDLALLGDLGSVVGARSIGPCDSSPGSGWSRRAASAW
ncbi:MAG: hypothetical protein IT457_00080 [Planctomycetes bacterium]|nr:hypothetical protein [Planctomycetota bacterium]